MKRKLSSLSYYKFLHHLYKNKSKNNTSLKRVKQHKFNLKNDRKKFIKKCDKITHNIKNKI